MKILELIKSIRFNCQLRAGGYYSPVRALVKDGGIVLAFGYNKTLLTEIKSRFENRKFDWDDKTWFIPITYRNLFQFEYLLGKHGTDPYARFTLRDSKIPDIERVCAAHNWKPYNHQIEMVIQLLSSNWAIWGARMGTGKTLAAIIAMSMLNIDWYWIGPKTPIVAVMQEFKRWSSPVWPTFVTFDQMKKLVESWPKGQKAPQGLVIDEISRIKNSTAQRSVATKYLADSMRSDWGQDCYIVGLSGTPAPKSPEDWWHICETVCPGFIREANTFLFRERLGIFEDKETIPGAGSYKSLITWRDSVDKCSICGKLSTEHNVCTHPFKACVNEITNLKDRLKGLVGIWIKEDCLDLPLKRYEILDVEPSAELKAVAGTLLKTTRRAADALIKLRCLSDGFQYSENVTGKRRCTVCHGEGKIIEYHTEGDLNSYLTPEEVSSGTQTIWVDDVAKTVSITPIAMLVDCPVCNSSGEEDTFERIITEVPCPKDDVLLAQLERNLEDGRLNVYGGFTGTIERVVRVCREADWHVIRVDGRGWKGYSPDGELDMTPTQLLDIYMNKQVEYPRVAFDGQPGAAGMGLTLTASPSTFFYSNDFNGESREQAEDRGHRIGMKDHGGLIIDCCHLKSDRVVIESLKKKRNLQYMTMTGLVNSILTLE